MDQKVVFFTLLIYPEYSNLIVIYTIPIWCTQYAVTVVYYTMCHLNCRVLKIVTLGVSKV